MLKDIKNTVKQSAVYGLSRISLKLVGFILFPIYSLHFTVPEYGIIVRAELFWQIINAFAYFAFEQALFRWASIKDNTKERNPLVFNVLILVVSVNLLFIAAGFLFSGQISAVLFESDEYSGLVMICLGISLFESLIGIPLVLIRLREQASKYVTLVVLNAALSMMLQLIVIYNTSYGVTGIFASKLIAPAIIFIIVSRSLISNMRFKFNIALVREILAFTLPLMFASLISMLLNGQDRFILGNLTDSGEVGLYGLAYNISGVLNFLLVSPFAIAFPVIFWKKVNDDNAARFFTKSVTYSQFALAWAAMALSLSSAHLIKIFALNPDYWLASGVIPIICFSIVMYNFHTIGFMSFYYRKNTATVLMILVITTVFNLIMNFILVPKLKMYGSAIALFLSQTLAAFLIYRLSAKGYFIRWEIRKILMSFTLAALLTFPFYCISFSSQIITIILKTLCIISYPVILYYFGFYEDIEITSIKGFIKKYRRKFL